MRKAAALLIISLFLFSSLAVLGSGGARATNIQAVDTSGLEVAYDFRNGGSGTNITDASGNGHYGTITGSGYTWNADYLHLDSSTHIEVSHPDTPGKNGTVEILFRIDSTPSTTSYIYDWDGSGTNVGDTSILVLTNDTIEALSTSSSSYVIHAYSFGSALNKWVFVTFVLDNGTEYLYINGTLMSSTSAPGAIFGNSNTVEAINCDDSSYAVNMDVKYFSYWGRALSGTEVEERYENITGNSASGGGDNGGNDNNTTYNQINFVQGVELSGASNVQGVYFDGTYYWEGDDSNDIHVYTTSGSLYKTISTSTAHHTSIDMFNSTTMVVGSYVANATQDTSNAKLVFISRSNFDVVKTVDISGLLTDNYIRLGPVCTYYNATNVVLVVLHQADWVHIKIVAIGINGTQYTVLKTWLWDATSYDDGSTGNLVSQGMAWDAPNNTLLYASGDYPSNDYMFALSLNSDGTVTVLHKWDVTSQLNPEQEGLAISQDYKRIYSLRTNYQYVYYSDINFNFTGQPLGVQFSGTNGGGDNGTGGSGGDNNTGGNNGTTNGTGGAGMPTGNASTIWKILNTKITIGGYAVRVWMLLAAAVVILWLFGRRR